MNKKYANLLAIFIFLPHHNSATAQEYPTQWIADLDTPQNFTGGRSGGSKLAERGLSIAKKNINEPILKIDPSASQIEKYAANAIKYGVKALVDEFNKTDKSEPAKKEAAMQIIEKSFLPYESARAGDLGVTLKHSLLYGTTRISWDDQTEEKMLCAYAIQASVGVNTDAMVRPSPGAEYSYNGYVAAAFGRRTPSYTVYRIVNGIETQIGFFPGEFERLPEVTLGTTKSYMRQAWDIYKLILKLNNDSKRYIFDDYSAPVLKPGSTISYRIVSDDSKYKSPEKTDICAKSDHIKSTTTALDSNRDGKIDFIPDSAYPNYPLITTTNFALYLLRTTNSQTTE